MNDRVLIIGADAAGMSAAHQALRTARRLGRSLELIVLERGAHTSYSACGIPYWISGEVPSSDQLVARTAGAHSEAGVDLRMHHEAVGVDLSARTCEVRDHTENRSYTIGFDQIMLATGAAPVVPPWAQNSPTVHAVTTLDDGASWQRILADGPDSAVVIGGGYIGVETAEAFARRGVRTMLLNRGRHLMAAALEPGTAHLAAQGLAACGVQVVHGVEVVDRQPDGARHRLISGDGREFTADAVAVAIGVTPRSHLLTEAGIADGGPALRGALVPDDHGRVGDGSWAAGDCTAVIHRTLNRAVFMPLGTHANKTGRVIGTNLGGGEASFPGVVGTAITRTGQVEVARTGVQTEWAQQYLDVDVVTHAMDSTAIAGYMPGAPPIRVWVVADGRTGRLLGCQIAGGQGSGKRIDTAATAIWNEMTLDEVAGLDLAYAPPFSPVWDPVQIACRSLAAKL